MANPIRDTPIIVGEDAKKFRETLRNTVKPWELYTDSEKKAILEERERIKQDYDLMVRISGGTFI
jgi:hypothetical protein